MPTVDNKYKHELYDFLNGRKALIVNYSNNTTDFTHTSIGDPKGSYYIDEQDIEKFWKIYHKAVFVDKIPVHLTERVSSMVYTPLKIDIDFRYNLDDEKGAKRIYQMEDIIKICQLYMEIINEYLEDFDDYEREFFIMEKPNATYINDTDKPYIKDGVHIVAPRIVTTETLQLLFREYVIKNCNKILEKYKFENSYADIFDICVINRNNWQMYGSSKPNHSPYLVTNIIKIWKDKYEIIPNKYTNYELAKTLSMRRNEIGSPIKFNKRDEVINQTIELMHKRQQRTIKANRKKLTTRKLKDDELNIIRDYIKCLNIERSKSFNTWIEVGWCLHNIDDRLLSDWIEFSKKSAKHSHSAELECNELWRNMSDEGLGIGSLKMWAKQDNRALYNKVVQDDLSGHIEMVGRLGKGVKPYDIAKILYHMYQDYYICVDVLHDRWYYYNENMHKWELDMKGCKLRMKISVEVYQQFRDKRDYYSSQSQESGDENFQKAENLGIVMSKLKDTGFKENIMMECKKEIFNVKSREFISCLDTNNHLLGFKNGVYDLKATQFRNGRPEDYISMTTDINYIPYDESNPDIQAIMKFYSSVFVIKKVRDYIFKSTASFLGGSTRDEHFYIYSGSGGNGKSKHIELIEAALGEYCCKLPVTLLTMKRAASNAANPELARTKGKRFATLQEPDTKTRINVGLMKELTGGDKIQARALYSDPIEFKPQYKLALICNDKPEMPSHDDGTWRRIRNIEFISKFVHSPVPERLLDFKMDADITEKIETAWAEPFMSILIHYYKRYTVEGLRLVPDEIVEYTIGYRSTNNHFQEFIDDCIDFANIDTPPVFSLDSIHLIYKDWYKQTHNDNKEKKRKDLKNFLDERLSGHLPVPQRRKIIGYRLHIKWKHFGSMGEQDGRTFDPDISSNASSSSSKSNDELDD